MKIRYLLFLGFVLLFTPDAFSQADSASVNSFASFLKSQKSLPDSVRFANIYEYAFTMADQLKFVETGLATTELMEIADRAGQAKWKGRTHMAMAYAEKIQNNTMLAVSNYQQAQAIFHAVGDFRREIRALQWIGGIYMDQRDLKLADYYLQRALKLARFHKQEDELAFLYTDFATIEDIGKNFTKALSYNGKAIEILKKMNKDYSATLFNRGIILKNAGRYMESIETYMQCLEYARKHSDKEMEEMVYVNLPNTLVRLNRLDEAERYALKALEMAKNGPQRIVVNLEAYEILTTIHQKRGNFEKAFSFQKKWMMYRDSLLNVEKSRQLIETEARFQTREKQQQIQRLAEENRNKKRQLVWLYGGVSLLAMLLAIALWQYRVIRSGNKQLGNANHTLSEANQQINMQSAQLKELMQELHHRVKNNLAIVSSLLSLQANRLVDAKAAQAVTDSQQRVEAMSLIHTQLYQTGNVTGVSMQQYIGDLAGGLMQSFRQKDNFDLKIDIEPIIINVETAVPLGLILNELVTNAFKHAYQEVSKPELGIRLWQEDQIYLEIKDNGKGMDAENWHMAGPSFGKRLIKSLTKQVRGKLEIHADNGTRFLLTFPR